MARSKNRKYYAGTRNNQSTRKGGTKVSTNEKFNNEVRQRMFGNSAGRSDQLPNAGNLPRVAAAGAGNVPEGIRVAANRAGGRNSAHRSERGGLTMAQYRAKELAEAFGTTGSAVERRRRDGSWGMAIG